MSKVRVRTRSRGATVAEQKKDYEVGYGRPPAHTRFQKGRSGNPKGRPKGSKNTDTIVREELSSLMSVREDGKTSRVSKRTAIVKQATGKALHGDIRFVKMMLELDDRQATRAEEVDAKNAELAKEAPLTPSDRAILDDFMEQRDRGSKELEPNNEGPNSEDPSADATRGEKS